MSVKGKRVLLILFFLILAVPGTAGAYTIQPGDTLSELAQLFQVEMEQLLKHNPDISHPDRIYAGQTLKLPNFHANQPIYIDHSNGYSSNPSSSTKKSISTYRLQSDQKDKQENTYTVSPMDKYWLSRIVHAEAKGEPFLGKVAVVHVILNRVHHEGFPDTIREVIFQPGQFQPVANGSIYQEPDEESIRAVEYALKTYDQQDKEILYFYNPKIATSSWIFTRPTVKVIGNHVFAR